MNCPSDYGDATTADGAANAPSSAAAASEAAAEAALAAEAAAASHGGGGGGPEGGSHLITQLSAAQVWKGAAHLYSGVHIYLR